jgi:hypothetical protein
MLLRDVPQADAGAALDQPLRYRQSDALRASGDDRHASFEIELVHAALREESGQQ